MSSLVRESDKLMRAGSPLGGPAFFSFFPVEEFDAGALHARVVGGLLLGQCRRQRASPCWRRDARPRRQPSEPRLRRPRPRPSRRPCSNGDTTSATTTSSSTTKNMIAYWQKLEKASPRIHLVQIGLSSEKRPMIMAIITSPGRTTRRSSAISVGHLEASRVGGRARPTTPRGACARERR